jgi:DNA-binding MarR family transcriptional regulator
VPQIARSRPVARQHIQRLANEAEAEGLIEFIDNPAHRRSKLMRITPQGETTYGELMGRMAALSEELASGMDAGAIAEATEVLRQLREKLGEG